MPKYKGIPLISHYHQWYFDLYVEAFRYKYINPILHDCLFTDLYVLIMLGTKDQDRRVKQHLNSLAYMIKMKCNAKL